MTVPVVLVHGIRLSGRCWAGAIDEIAPERTVATVDLPGHGPRRGEPFTMSTAVAAVRTAVEQVGGRALLVGHSLGGYAGIAAAAELGDQAAGLVVAGSTCVPGKPSMVPFRLAHRALSTRPDGGERLSNRMFEAVLPPEVAHAIEQGGIATEIIPDVLHALGQFDPLAELGRYGGPVWLINGSRDYFRAHEHRFAAATPRTRLLVVPRAGHYLPLAEPRRFARLVRDIADSCDTDSGRNGGR